MQATWLSWYVCVNNLIAYLLGFYIPATPNVIGLYAYQDGYRFVICTHGLFYSAAPLGNQAVSIMTDYSLSHIILTVSQPVLVQS